MIWLFSGRNAFAASDFSFNYRSQVFKIPAETVASWQSQQTLTPNSILTPAPANLSSQFLGFIGQPATEAAQVSKYDYQLKAIYNYIHTLASNIDQPTQEPALTIQNGRAVEFTPPQNGEQTDVYQSSLAALKALEAGQTTVNLVVYETLPEVSLAETNSLGINSLIAEGVSNFAGSPKNRRFNIAVGIEKFKGVIIQQGQEFSFDDNLGPVTADAGFLPELVIDNGTTQPELGGGLCQVSTTTFRAAMNAGVPITDRRNHAYAVQYYSPQGTDATIYPGSADLRFINDTPGAILIWPYEKDKNTLVFDFYGTSDGRQVTLEKPEVYDKKTDGSMKATWTRLVTLPGQPVRTDVFKSTYQPPALFHKTEQFVSASATPAGLLTPKTN